jgi:hypothetical protein
MLRDPGASEKICERLDQAGFKSNWLKADAVWHSLDALEGFERLIQTAEKRRDRLLQQLIDWRDRRDTHLRKRSAPEVIDIDAHEVSST